ncbi:MAG: alpha-L-fucosidase [Bacteroidetes bacterium]|nr:alpha-L-fucosidase [Bacteroidota bacterium]
MKKSPLLLSVGIVMILMMACNTDTKSQEASDVKIDKDERMEWWREAKFGLFIHWGVYAVPAGQYGENTGYGEWIMHNARIPSAEYKEYARRFNPVRYDPEAWVRVAKEAGMKYIVITSKHHDGFALYPSAVTDWDVADATPYGKDLLGPLVKEAHEAGLKMGFYYSQAQDWNHPGGAKSRFEEGDGWDEAHKGDFDTYLETIALPQAKEILTQYPLDILWWDTPTWMNEERTRPFVEALKVRPWIITNNRLGIDGDTKTPEQFVPVTGHEGDWETCMTMNGHWGYNARDDNWKSSEELIHKLIEICSKGGNYLLNVGPTAEGEFPQACIERLQDMGAWLKVNGEAIYGTTAGPFTYLSWGAATRKGNLLYLHVTDWPASGKLNVPLTSKVESASLLVNPGESLGITTEAERVVIELPLDAPDPVGSVVILKLAEEPVAMPIASLGKTILASGEHPNHPALNAADGSGHEIWEAADSTGECYLEFDLGEPALISAAALDEPDRWPRYKQSIRMEAETENGWEELFAARTKGHGLVRKFDPVRTSRVRLYVNRKEGPPAVAEWQLYAPE